jgi:phosphotransferase system HPr (HPr) family protein
VPTSRHATIATATGLHARPAGLFAKTAAATGVPVTIAREDGPAVDAASVLMVMGLGLKHGETVVLSADDERVLDELAAVLATDLDAPATV